MIPQYSAHTFVPTRFTDFGDIRFARLDRDKANNIPRMHDGAFGSAQLKLQL
jgi:hypothetical protein